MAESKLEEVDSFEYESTPAEQTSQVEEVDSFKYENPDDDPTFVENVVKGADKLLDVGKGLVLAPWNLLTGAGETVTGAIDYVFDTNITPTFSKAMNHMAEPYETKYWTGKVAEVGGEFGIEFIPFFKGMGVITRSARGLKNGTAVAPAASRMGRALQKIGRSKFGQTLVDDTATAGAKLRKVAAGGALGGAYFGLSGALFAPDNRPTLMGDTFEEIPLPFTDKGIPLPFKTQRTEGLEGRDYAKELFMRKFMRGADVGATSVVGDAALYGLGQAARAPVVANTAAATARTIRDATSIASQSMAETALVQGMKANPVVQMMGKSVEKPKRFIQQYFTPDGGADEFLARSLRDSIDSGDAMQRGAIEAVNELHDATNNLINQTKFWQMPKVKAKLLNDDIVLYQNGAMTFEDFSKSWGEKAARSMDRIIDANFKIQDRTIKLLDDEIASAAPGSERRKKAEEALQIIRDSQEAGEFYRRRLFEAHENPIRFLQNLDIKDPLYNKAIDEFAITMRGFDDTKNMTDAEVRELARQQVNESLMLPALNRPGADFETVVRDKIRALNEQNNKFYGILAADAPKVSVKEDFLIPRKEAIDKSPAFRALMGEINDPIESTLRTISDLTQTIVAKGYYDSLARNKTLAPTLDKAMTMLDNGGRPPIVMVPTKADFEARNKLLVTMGRDARTASDAAKREVPSEEALLEVVERLGSKDVMLEADEVAKLESQLQNRGYVRLGGEEALDDVGRAVFGGRYGKLTGMWVTPETRAMLNQPVNLSPLGGVMSAIQATRAFSQKMMIVPSPAGQARNIAGNVAMLTGNGNLHRGTDLLETFYLFSRSLDEVDDAGLKDMARRINYSGLQDSSIIYESLKEYQRMGRQLGAGEKVSKAYDAYEDIIPFMAQFQKLYAQSDAFFKALALNGEYNKYAHALRRSGFDETFVPLLDSLVEAGIAKPRTGRLENMTFLEEIAANIVKDTMPMYNRVPEGLRFMDRIPFFGNFTSFASENIRNAFNTINIGAKELMFEVSPAIRQKAINEMGKRGVAPDVAEAQIKAFEGSIRANGSQRMFNTLAVANIVPMSIQKMSMKATNTTDTEMEAILESQEDFTSGDDFMIVSNDHRGNFTIIDISYHNPYGYLRSAANAALDAYAKAGKLNKAEYEQIGAGLWKFVEKMGDPFAAESMISERFADATIRNGKTKTGASIYDEDEGWGQQIYNSLLHVGESFVPRYGLEFFEADREEIREGKLLRALKGMPGKNEEELNVGQEAVRMIFGLTPMELKGGKQLQYDAQEYKGLRDPAASRARSKFRDMDRTTEEKYQAFLDYADSLANSQSLMYYKIDRARRLGVPEAEIKRRLAAANIGNAEIDALLTGELYLAVPSDDLIGELEERAQYEDYKPMGVVPFERILDYIQENDGRKLDARSFQEDEGTAVPEYERYEIIDEFDFESDNFEEVDTFEFEQESALPQAPVTQPMQTAAAQVNPIVLGNDPATQALAKSLGRSQ